MKTKARSPLLGCSSAASEWWQRQRSCWLVLEVGAPQLDIPSAGDLLSMAGLHPGDNLWNVRFDSSG